MNDLVILGTYLPGEGCALQSERYKVTRWLCTGAYDYWASFVEYWDTPSVIVSFEHDVGVEDAHIEALLACSQDACSFAFEAHWQTTHLGRDVISAGAGERCGEEWAMWSAVGLVKLTPAARIAPLRKEPWQRVELAIEDAVKRPWHIHWGPPYGPPDGPPELPHHHW